MLTKPEIEAFEARAAAGEKPAMPWEDNFPNPGQFKFWLLPNFFVVRPFKRGKRWKMLFTNLDDRAVECETRSKVAAQLAAEHVIKTATLPLHRRNDEDAMANLAARVETLEEQLTEARELISDLKGEIDDRNAFGKNGAREDGE